MHTTASATPPPKPYISLSVYAAIFAATVIIAAHTIIHVPDTVHESLPCRARFTETAFAISCDDTGSFMGKWSGTYVINHPFFLPGCLGLVAAIPFGFLMAGLVF